MDFGSLFLTSVVREIADHELGTVVQCKQNFDCSSATAQILPAANDYMVERMADRISFDNSAPSQQEYRASP
jgi:hypothetical protein